MSRTIRPLFALLMLTALVGCDDAEPVTRTVESPSAPRSTVTETGPPSFASVEELRGAAVQAGVMCVNWVQHQGAEVVGRARESGTCNGEVIDVLAIFDSAADRDTTMVELQGEAERRSSTLSVLSGPDWILVSPAAPVIARTLGGTMMTP